MENSVVNKIMKLKSNFVFVSRIPDKKDFFQIDMCSLFVIFEGSLYHVLFNVTLNKIRLFLSTTF